MSIVGGFTMPILAPALAYACALQLLVPVLALQQPKPPNSQQGAAC